MKQGDKKCGWSLLLIFAAPLLVTSATAFAQDSARKTSSYAPVAIKESFDTIMNYYELFNGILNPRQLEGVRLLVTPFPPQ